MIAEAQKAADAEAAKAEGEEPATEENKEEESKEEEKKDSESGDKKDKKAVDTAKINALNKMLDDFENILSKNFCQFANYEDFSFAKSRTTESL